MKYTQQRMKMLIPALILGVTGPDDEGLVAAAVAIGLDQFADSACECHSVA